MRLRREEADAVLGLITERSISKQSSEFPEKGPQTFESLLIDVPGFTISESNREMSILSPD